MSNKIIDQTKLFASTQKAFDMGTLKTLLQADAVNDTTFTKSKNYFLNYYAKSLSDAYYKYTPSEEDDDGLIENIPATEMNSVFNQIGKQKYNKEDCEKTLDFCLKTWFHVNHYDTYKINCDPRAEKFYISKKTGQRFINLSKGFLHKVIKPYDSFPENVKNNVQTVLNHIKNVWNSGNIDAYEFCLKWLAFACTGHKMNTSLFLKSAEGTGKSFIVEFLVKFVIGQSLGLITSRAESLFKFNSHLLGKILVCLEELPSGTKNAWYSISDYLKDLITGSKLDIEKKYHDMIQTVNLISLIIITNNENCIRFGKDIRRYMMCDISHDCVGNTKYFDNLAKACNKETGEALYMYFLELCEKNKNWNPAEIPMTLNKLEMKESNETDILKFVKDKYLKNGKGMTDPAHKEQMIKVNWLKDKFNQEYQQDLSSKSFNIKIKSDIPIVKIKPHGKEKELYIEPINFILLKKFFVDRGFWNDKYDQFNKGAKVEDVIDHGIDKTDQSINIDYSSEIERLRKENEELKKKLAKYEVDDIVHLKHIKKQMSDKMTKRINQGLNLFINLEQQDTLKENENVLDDISINFV